MTLNGCSTPATPPGRYPGGQEGVGPSPDSPSTAHLSAYAWAGPSSAAGRPAASCGIFLMGWLFGHAQTTVRRAGRSYPQLATIVFRLGFRVMKSRRPRQGATLADSAVQTRLASSLVRLTGYYVATTELFGTI
jgi:hypothetical protein